ncbi:hypothetical protein H920_09998 [Fukomys damarensis]|uniref:Uncharacterized protein n=1 Tax=Fukomys damarensis TaxID=885580 RepID=A0A091D8Z5_FUKDA|nr:hypothetical protein H920_09998 [Fukomys damarensis]
MCSLLPLPVLELFTHHGFSAEILAWGFSEIRPSRRHSATDDSDSAEDSSLQCVSKESAAAYDTFSAAKK